MKKLCMKIMSFCIGLSLIMPSMVFAKNPVDNIEPTDYMTDFDTLQPGRIKYYISHKYTLSENDIDFTKDLIIYNGSLEGNIIEPGFMDTAITQDGKSYKAVKNSHLIEKYEAMHPGYTLQAYTSGAKPNFANSVSEKFDEFIQSKTESDGEISLNSQDMEYIKNLLAYYQKDKSIYLDVYYVPVRNVFYNCISLKHLYPVSEDVKMINNPDNFIEYDGTYTDKNNSEAVETDYTDDPVKIEYGKTFKTEDYANEFLIDNWEEDHPGYTLWPMPVHIDFQTNNGKDTDIMSALYYIPLPDEDDDHTRVTVKYGCEDPYSDSTTNTKYASDSKYKVKNITAQFISYGKKGEEIDFAPLSAVSSVLALDAEPTPIQLNRFFYGTTQDLHLDESVMYELNDPIIGTYSPDVIFGVDTRYYAFQTDKHSIEDAKSLPEYEKVIGASVFDLGLPYDRMDAVYSDYQYAQANVKFKKMCQPELMDYLSCIENDEYSYQATTPVCSGQHYPQAVVPTEIFLNCYITKTKKPTEVPVDQPKEEPNEQDPKVQSPSKEEGKETSVITTPRETPSPKTEPQSLQTSNNISISVKDGKAKIEKVTGDVISLPSTVQKDGKTLPVTSIAKNAFSDNNDITEIVIPKTVTEIGENAFKNCINLEKVTIGKNVKKIKNGAFMGCASLQTVSIPTKVKAIPKNCFKNCISLSKVSGMKNVTSISDSAFENTAIKTIVIPAKVTSIGKKAFYECGDLISVTFKGKKIKTIKAKAFKETGKRTKYKLPKAAKYKSKLAKAIDKDAIIK